MGTAFVIIWIIIICVIVGANVHKAKKSADNNNRTNYYIPRERTLKEKAQIPEAGPATYNGVHYDNSCYDCTNESVGSPFNTADPFRGFADGMFAKEINKEATLNGKKIKL